MITDVLLGDGNSSRRRPSRWLRLEGWIGEAVPRGAPAHDRLARPGRGGSIPVGTAAASELANGNGNTAIGTSALEHSTGASGNTAIGYLALRFNNAYDNTAVGSAALESAVAGVGNVAIGHAAGQQVTNGSLNVEIANVGTPTDQGVIRIGTAGSQTQTYIAGIVGAVVGAGAVPVYVGPDGRLGALGSSERFKDDIGDMGDATKAISALRPVTFRYRGPMPDGSRPVQYGLVAEEVAQVYPDLATYDRGGQPNGVRYDALPVMLLNEVNRQRAEIEKRAAENGQLRAEVNELRAEIARSERRTNAPDRE